MRENTNTVAVEILRQLGGNKFLAMTGAKNLISDNNTLCMNLPKNCSKSTYLEITLNSMDTYDMVFKIRQRKKDASSGLMLPYWVGEKQFNGLYCDQLQDIFTKHTGMRTSL